MTWTDAEVRSRTLTISATIFNLRNPAFSNRNRTLISIEHGVNNTKLEQVSKGTSHR